MKNINQDRHFRGAFLLDGEELQGEIIYSIENGVIQLNLTREVSSFMGKSYGNQPEITGRLFNGADVTLYHNVCIENHTQAFSYQDLVFRTDYLALGETQAQYDQLTCILENGLLWSDLSQIDTSEIINVKFHPPEEKIFHWFGAKITFSTNLDNDLFGGPQKEVSQVIERLELRIEAEGKRDIPYFLSIRNKVISLISFAIKDNINIEEQFLFDFDDYEMVGEHKHYRERSFISADPYCYLLYTNHFDYNFKLPQLIDAEGLPEKLEKLVPIFNLYLSLFKYRHMPREMVFLNIVQALETFHSRFFYGDKKEKYLASVEERFGDGPEWVKNILCSTTQMDPNCNYIILVSRLNDLLIGKFSGLFLEFYAPDGAYAQRIADTRHYYTHYGKSKEEKALKGDELLGAIYVLRLLLEYHICQVLGINVEKSTRRQLGIFLVSKTE